MNSEHISLPADYAELLGSLREQIRAAQVHARRVINTGLIDLYWSIGHTILLRQAEDGWGSGVVSRLADDLRREFPEMKGISRSSLNYMRGFASAWPEQFSIFQQPVGKLPWGHIMLLIDKLGDRGSRDWYAAEAVAHGWSRNVLLNQIKNRTLERSGAAPSNFEERLPDPDSELAQQIAKDPYVFDFLGLGEEVAERQLENALTGRIVETLRELGQGFAFGGRRTRRPWAS